MRARRLHSNPHRSVRRWGAVTVVAALSLVTLACSSDNEPSVGTSVTDSTSTDSITEPEPSNPPAGSASIAWTSDPNDDRVQTGSLAVPIDYSDPSKGTIDLALARHLADPDRRIGSLLVNPGGPGFSGLYLATDASSTYSQTLVDHFDIVAWDPRGVGESQLAIDCIDDYDRFYATSDITPDDTAERTYLVNLADEFATACATKNADIIEYVGTNNTARDMDRIRQALGEEKISYFGFSYGSELGATWATLFPDTVRAAVLDGASDPNADFIESGLQQSAGFERTLATFLAQCGADTSCAFHNRGDAEGAFDELMTSLDQEPIASMSGRPDINLQVAITAVSLAMYSDTLWDWLADALASAQDGDGSGLLDLYDAYYDRLDDGTWSNSLEAFQTIYCMDRVERLSVTEEDATAADFQAAAPRLAPGTTGSYFCTFFPASIDPRVEITGRGASPIVVMGTTGDPATPLESTRAMAAALEDGRLVIVDADQHTGYGVNDCSTNAIDDYLIDPMKAAPVNGLEC